MCHILHPCQGQEQEPRLMCEQLVRTFIIVYKITYEASKQNVSIHESLKAKIVSYEADNDLWIQSSEFVSDIRKFSLKIHTDLWYESLNMGIKTNISVLCLNRI